MLLLRVVVKELLHATQLTTRLYESELHEAAATLVGRGYNPTSTSIDQHCWRMYVLRPLYSTVALDPTFKLALMSHVALFCFP
jgi:hypothetical protein